MKTIQEELGGASSHQDVSEMKTRSLNKKWSKKVKTHFDKELAKLERINSQVAEYGVQRNYLELLLDLPWDEFSKDKFDLNRAQRILDRDHFGLEEVKKRIIEFLAVLKLAKGYEVSHLVFDWATRSRKNIFRQIDCRSSWQRICSYFPWWDAR